MVLPPRFFRTHGHRDVLVRGYVHEVVISCGAEVIARHPRSYEREDFVFDPLHYLALIEQKINALDQAAPLACVYRIFDSAWTQRTDGVSSRPDAGSVQADSRRPGFAL